MEIYEELLNYVSEIGMGDIIQVEIDDPPEYDDYPSDLSIKVYVESYDFPEFGSIIEEITPDGRWVTYINGNLREDYKISRADLWDKMIEGAKWLISKKLESVK